MIYSVRSASAKSRCHDKNEDSYFIGDDYVIVADGMGGESTGDIASQIVVRSISHTLKSNLPDDPNECEVKELMFSAIAKADGEIAEYVEKHPDSWGMGTTVLLLVCKSRNIYLAWCGDSRCYVYRDGKIRSLTKDHSYVQELIDAQKITVDESFTHPDSNLITRYVGGGNETCIPDFASYAMAKSDIVILCSDGLSGYCRCEDVGRCISSDENVEDLPARLLNLAIRHGSDDDITIITMSCADDRRASNHSSLFGWLRSRLSVRRG